MAFAWFLSMWTTWGWASSNSRMIVLVKFCWMFALDLGTQLSKCVTVTVCVDCVVTCTVTANVSAESDAQLCQSSAMNRFQLYLPVII